MEPEDDDNIAEKDKNTPTATLSEEKVIDPKEYFPEWYPRTESEVPKSFHKGQLSKASSSMQQALGLRDRAGTAEKGSLMMTLSKKSHDGDSEESSKIQMRVLNTNEDVAFQILSSSVVEVQVVNDKEIMLLVKPKEDNQEEGGDDDEDGNIIKGFNDSSEEASEEMLVQNAVKKKKRKWQVNNTSKEESPTD